MSEKKEKRKLQQEEEGGSGFATRTVGAEEEEVQPPPSKQRRKEKHVKQSCKQELPPPSSKQRRKEEHVNESRKEEHVKESVKEEHVKERRKEEHVHVHATPATPRDTTKEQSSKSRRSSPRDKKKTPGGNATIIKKWTAREELSVANAILSSLCANGTVDKPLFYERVTRDLNQAELTKTQLREKMRSMHTRYKSISNYLKANSISVAEFGFKSPQEPQLFEIWKQIWGAAAEEEPPQGGGGQGERETHAEQIEVVMVADDADKSREVVADGEKGHSRPHNEKPLHAETQRDGGGQEGRESRAKKVEVEDLAEKSEEILAQAEAGEEEKKVEAKAAEKEKKAKAKAAEEKKKPSELKDIESITKLIAGCCESVINRTMDRIGVSLPTECELGFQGCLCSRLRKWIKINMEEIPGVDAASSSSLHRKSHAFKLNYLNMVKEHLELQQEECKLTIQSLNA